VQVASTAVLPSSLLRGDDEASSLGAVGVASYACRRMRKQYYFRPSEQGLLAWDVDRLVTLSQHFAPMRVPLSAIRELDEPFWSGLEDAPTWRAIIEQVRLMEAADLSFAIILASDGRVMDGRHRVAKAVLLGRESIEAVQFTKDPEPDFIGMHPNELPYDAAPNEGAADFRP
jgi:hypothetical protein